MSALHNLIPEPDRVEIDRVDVAVDADRAWEVVRHGNLARSALIRALFALRTLPTRLRGGAVDPVCMRIDDIVGQSRPGFRLLAESETEVVIGAVGKVWELDIPFVDIQTSDDFARFDEPGFTKVAWALRSVPRGERNARLELELGVHSTDEEARRRFRRYFRIVGPASRFIRREVLESFARELGLPEGEENERALPGDELLPDASARLTHGITIAAPAESIWPWLVQMGCRRAGWYSYDVLDNAGVESAHEIHPELQRIEVGDVLPATPEGDDGFEVLRVEPRRVLILGGLFDPDAKAQLPFSDERPERYWHVSWAFVLEPLGPGETRLIVRARAAFPETGRLHATWIRSVHHFMESAQLRGLKARVEGSLPRDSWRDVSRGLLGSGAMVLSFLTPFLRDARQHWGLDAETAGRDYPGDELVSEPRWGWTHGVEIDATPEEVWPWVAQIGADRGGFYSYQWLENVAGCDVKNAETIHPEWVHLEGDELVLHPKLPPLKVVLVEPGCYFVAYAPRQEGSPWVSASWLFLVEPLDAGRSRFTSRFRSDCSDDLVTRLAYGPLITEPVGFVMDRRMLLGVKERAEKRS
ncbi:MAG TPA: hypothetical protein VLK65_01895 [Vicinamibacteria bacterium]|nr:hypothetical protein [Vicinamibacteria bacterium]